LGFTGGVSGSGTGTAVPIGGCIPYGGAGAPSGFVLCDGAAISRAAFANLFAIIGTAYGVGDGSTTFNVPDMRTSNSFARGAINDGGRGTTGGAASITQTIAQMPAHLHSVDGSSTLGAGANFAVGDVFAATRDTNSTGGGASMENQPPFVDFNWIIKA